MYQYSSLIAVKGFLYRLSLLCRDLEFHLRFLNTEGCRIDFALAFRDHLPSSSAFRSTRYLEISSNPVRGLITSVSCVLQNSTTELLISIRVTCITTFKEDVTSSFFSLWKTYRPGSSNNPTSNKNSKTCWGYLVKRSPISSGLCAPRCDFEVRYFGVLKRKGSFWQIPQT